jgi:hypothetical protein
MRCFRWENAGLSIQRLAHRQREHQYPTTMTKRIPFTAASLARAIRGVELAGRFVVGVKPDGTLIVGDRPIDTASLFPAEAEPDSKWRDVTV